MFLSRKDSLARSFLDPDIAALRTILNKPVSERQSSELLVVAQILKDLKYFQSQFVDEKERLDFVLNCAKFFKYEYFPKGHEIMRKGEDGNDFYIIFQGEACVFVPKHSSELQVDAMNTNKKLAYEDYNAFMKKHATTETIMMTSGFLSQTSIEKRRTKRFDPLDDLASFPKSKNELIKERVLRQNNGICSSKNDLTFDEKLLLLNNYGDPSYFSHGICTFKKVATLGPGEYFGELALIFNQLRSATVIASQDLHVVSIDCWNYRAIFESDIQNLWKKIDFFKLIFENISAKMIARFCYMLEEKKFSHNEIIYKENDEADGIYIIKQGEVQLSKYLDPKAETNQITRTKKMTVGRRKIIVSLYDWKITYDNKAASLLNGSFFGENEVISDSVREYTAVSYSSNTIVFKIKKVDYISTVQKYFGPIDAFIQQKAKFNEKSRKNCMKKHQEIIFNDKLSSSRAQTERSSEDGYIMKSSLLNQDVKIQLATEYTRENGRQIMSLMKSAMKNSKEPKQQYEPDGPMSSRKPTRLAAIKDSPRTKTMHPSKRFGSVDGRIKLEDYGSDITPPKIGSFLAVSPSGNGSLRTIRGSFRVGNFSDLVSKASNSPQNVRKEEEIAKLECLEMFQVKNVLLFPRDSFLSTRLETGDTMSPMSSSKKKETEDKVVEKSSIRPAIPKLKILKLHKARNSIRSCFGSAGVPSPKGSPRTDHGEGRTIDDKIPQVHKVLLSPERIQRIDHEYVNGDRLLSAKFSETKVSPTKHNMFRTFKFS